MALIEPTPKRPYPGPEGQIVSHDALQVVADAYRQRAIPILRDLGLKPDSPQADAALRQLGICYGDVEDRIIVRPLSG